MSASAAKTSGATPPRPSKLQTTKSFTRFEPVQPRVERRSRASTLSNEVLPPTAEVSAASEQPDDQPLNDVRKGSTSSVFEKQEEEDGVDTPRDSTVNSPTDLPPDFDELPIEIASWIDRFVAELQSAKKFPSPPSADKLSDIFQDFYLKAEQKIGMHIRMLASRQSRAESRAASPAPSVQSRSSVRPRPSPRLNSSASRDSLRRTDTSNSAQPMLTPSEVHERRRARRLLEYKRVALEEAVERRLCELLYPKLWRHKSTLDDVRDEKLRGKTGSLQLVGIGLQELGVDLTSSDDQSLTSAERAVMVEEWISKAAEGLLQMNEPHNPKGKLDSLIAAHQKIVDLLTKVHKGSSSADEILPTLIYCLLTSPPEGLNIISNMTFIQRFRAANKMNGEAAYCLTNLEAAITFLETVDLASLRGAEATDSAESSAITSRPATPMTATFAPTQFPERSSSIAATNTSTATARPQKARTTSATGAVPGTSSRPASHHRRLSSLIGVPANAFNAANDAVRNTAEESFRSVSTTLDSSFKFLFGRLKEQQLDSPDAEKSVVLPRTLEEARKLVTPKPAFDEDGNISENSSFQEADEDHPLKESPATENDDKLLGLIAGKPRGLGLSQPRERSADSKASNDSGLRKISGLSPLVATPAPGSGTGTQALDTAAEAFRTFGSSINPLNRLSGAGFMRGFGRTNTPPSGEQISPPPGEPKDKSKVETSPTDKTKIDKYALGSGQTFVDTKLASDLKIGDVQDLLLEYQRLVEYLKRNELV